MRVIKKKGIKKIRVKHNKKLLYLILFLIVLLGVFVTYIAKSSFKVVEDNSNVSEELKCVNDEECVPASCCHSNSCINSNFKIGCEGMFCTAVCAGPLDCGAGSCKCINGKCDIVKNE